MCVCFLWVCAQACLIDIKIYELRATLWVPATGGVSKEKKKAGGGGSGLDRNEERKREIGSRWCMRKEEVAMEKHGKGPTAT